MEMAEEATYRHMEEVVKGMEVVVTCTHKVEEGKVMVEGETCNHMDDEAKVMDVEGIYNNKEVVVEMGMEVEEIYNNNGVVVEMGMEVVGICSNKKVFGNGRVGECHRMADNQQQQQ